MVYWYQIKKGGINMDKKFTFYGRHFTSKEDAADYILESMNRKEYENIIAPDLPEVVLLGIELDPLEILRNMADIDFDMAFEDWKDSLREDLENELANMQPGDYHVYYGIPVSFHDFDQYAIPDETPVKWEPDPRD